MEGPSVHHLSEQVELFEGQRVDFVDGNADQPLENLDGKTIDRVRAVKKRLFFDAGAVHVIIHFLMFGSYRVNETREGMEPRLVLDCTKDVFLTYNSAVRVLLDGDEKLDYYDRPEEDVLSDEFNRQQAREALPNYEGPVVDVLLNQDVFGRVGNIIKNEVLFRTNRFPGVAAQSLADSECDELIDETMDFSKHRLKTKRTGDPLGLKIYQKNLCPHCGDQVQKQQLGENNRVTYWCPTCQCK